MIILDTHIWVWWVHGDERITSTQAEIVKSGETDIIGVSAISAWEIAKLVEYNRLELPCPLNEWFYEALSYAVYDHSPMVLLHALLAWLCPSG